MTRFFARLFAILLSVSIFVIGAAFLAQIEPISGGGWIVLGLVGLAVLGGPVLVYFFVMSQVKSSPLPNEGEGAGLAMGAAIDTARRRDGDGDFDDDGLGFD